jgi:hypothetical protein
LVVEHNHLAWQDLYVPTKVAGKLVTAESSGSLTAYAVEKIHADDGSS